MARRGPELRNQGQLEQRARGPCVYTWYDCRSQDLQSRKLGDLPWKATRPHTGMREAPGDREGVRGPTDQEVGSLSSRETACTHILLTVGQAAVLAHGHGLLLDVILCEKPRLACHHLLNRCWDDHIINVVIRLPWLPLLGWDDLCGPRRVWVMQLTRVGDPRSPRLVLPHTGTTQP